LTIILSLVNLPKIFGNAKKLGLSRLSPRGNRNGSSAN
jgi:hypothetical protein